MAFVYDEHVILREIVDQAEGARALGAAVEITRVVFDAGAVPQLLDHLDVVFHALFDTLRLRRASGTLEEFDLPAQIQVYLLYGAVDALLGGYEEARGVERQVVERVDTLERIQILEDLRAGMFDVLVGVNLLREGLDLPEVALVAILDADKEGFLRNVRSLTQIAGRAARHSQGNVILYADTCTDSMRFAIEQSNRRREKQVRYNMEHGMLPRRAQKSGTGQSTLLSARTDVPEIAAAYPLAEDHYMAAADVQKTYVASENIDTLIDKAREDMERAAKSLDFLAAAKFRDRMYELQKLKEENRKG